MYAAMLPLEMWSEPSPQVFLVRSQSYLRDHQKIPAELAVYKLQAVDLFEIDTPVTNIASHPLNRIALAAVASPQLWFFIVNIMVPGPPDLAFVMYFEGDKVHSLLFIDYYHSLPNGRVQWRTYLQVSV